MLRTGVNVGLLFMIIPCMSTRRDAALLRSVESFRITKAAPLCLIIFLLLFNNKVKNAATSAEKTNDPNVISFSKTTLACGTYR